ncbi:MAG: hypothetical protein V3R99_11355 [Thermoguttaceae bacterium]
MAVLVPNTSYRTISHDAMRQESRLRMDRYRKAELHEESLHEDRLHRLQIVAVVLGIVLVAAAVFCLTVAVPPPEGIELDTFWMPL